MKSNQNMELVQIYLIFLNDAPINTNILEFFLLIFFNFFPLGSGPRRENESGSTALPPPYLK